MTLTLSPVPGAYVNGMHVTCRTAFAAAGNDTLNVNALGPKNVYINGAATAVSANYWSNAQEVEFIYDATYNGAAGGWQVVSPSASPQPAMLGGTGVASPAAHAVAIGEGASAFNFAPIGTSGGLFIDQGAGADPSFNAMSGDATITNAGVVTLAKKLKTVSIISYEVGAENAPAVLVTADLSSHAVKVNDAYAKTLVEASCISDAGDQAITVTIGAVTLFTIHCVAPGMYSDSTTDGTTGYIIAANMGSTAIGTHAQLDLSGTANLITKDVKLFAYGTVN